MSASAEPPAALAAVTATAGRHRRPGPNAGPGPLTALVQGLRAGRGRVLAASVLALVLGALLLLAAPSALAAPGDLGGDPASSFDLEQGQFLADPEGPDGPDGPSGSTSVTVELDGLTKKPNTSVALIIAMTLISLLPAIMLTCTSFTKILVVLGLTRNALGLQQTPNNQVLAGLALFLSLFIMAPVLSQMNDVGMQPYLDGDKTASVAMEDGIEPLREFMIDQTGDDELVLLTNVAGKELPNDRADVGMTTLVPAFVLSELKEAFIIGFIIFIPFLVIDVVVSGALMALGMMMMPPTMVSLPFKLLLFVLVDGWGLIVSSLVSSYGTGG